MNKSYVLLKMYDAIRTDEGIKIVACCNTYGISVATFRRYMAFLRAYFMETLGREIIYDAARALYILKPSA